MRAAASLLFSTLFAASAQAQDWATIENCTVDTPAIHEAVFAPSDFATLAAKAAQIPNSTGKFWQITSPEGNVSHLWGTFHSADPLILTLPTPVIDAIQSARVVAVEVDFTLKSRQAYRDAQMMEGRFKDASDPFDFEPGDGTIAGLSPEVSSWVRDRAFELGWTEDFDLVLSLPGIAELLLSDPCEDFVEGIYPIQDDYIQLLGRMAGASVLSLENSDEFVTYLAENQDTARAIIATYAAYLMPVTSNAERATSYALYQQGLLGVGAVWDAAFQQQVYGPGAADTLRLTDAYLLDERNQTFLARAAQDLAQGGTFMAVGSAHLPGENGLVALLRGAGYTVTRIPLPGEAP